MKKIFVTAWLAVIVYLFIFQVMAIWPFTIDDMYISLRYAKNWASGAGLLWNIHDLPVEGYSNFSFVAIAALALESGFNPVILLKCCGVAGLFFTVWAVFRLSRFWFDLWLAWVPCFWLLLYKGQIIWTASGLETTVYQALIGFALYFLLLGMGYNTYPEDRGEARAKPVILSGFLLALASLTRPEAPVLMLLFFGLAWFDRQANGSDDPRRRAIYMGCLMFGIIYLPWFLWRWHYFGRLFPNPVYCKGFTDWFSLEMDKNYLRLVWPLLLLAMPAIWKSADRRHFYFWLPGLVYLFLLAGSLSVAAFSNRLFLPAFMLLLPLSFLGFSRIVTYFIPSKKTAYVALATTSVLLAFLVIPFMSLENYRYFTENPVAGEQLRQEVYQWLVKHVKKGQVVLGDSGMIPYLSPLEFIDSWCLNNRKMTEQSDGLRYQNFCDQLLTSKPEAIILTSLSENGRITYSPADACLQDKLAGNKRFVFRKIFVTGDRQSTYRYEIYTPIN